MNACIKGKQNKDYQASGWNTKLFLWYEATVLLRLWTYIYVQCHVHQSFWFKRRYWMTNRTVLKEMEQGW
jgi:hypothetical protein